VHYKILIMIGKSGLDGSMVYKLP